MNNTRKPRGHASSNGLRSENAPSHENGAAPEPLAFEEALGRLDETVAALEGGQLPLEDALRLFEEGVRMAQRCQEMLDNAELRVQRLRMGTEHADDSPSDNLFILEPFALDDE